MYIYIVIHDAINPTLWSYKSKFWRHQQLGIPILMNDIPRLQKAVPKELSHHLIENNDPKFYAEIIINYFKSLETYFHASKLSKDFARKEFDAINTNQKVFDFISN